VEVPEKLQQVVVAEVAEVDQQGLRHHPEVVAAEVVALQVEI
jgi:hypothetical protein